MSEKYPDRAELVQKYLHASMNEEESAYLTQLLDTDEEFAKDVQIEAAAYAQRSLRLKTMLRKEFGEAAVKQVAEKKVKRYLPFWAKVAAILVVLLLSFWAIENLRQNPDSTVNLTDTYFEQKHPEPPTLMNGETPKIDAWEIAKEAYRKNEYEVAIEQITAIESPTDEQLLYLALSHGYKEEADFEEASSNFERIIAKPNSQIRDQALWYISIFSLKANQQAEAKANQQAEAKAYLQTILDEKSWQQEKAEKLLRSLE